MGVCSAKRVYVFEPTGLPGQDDEALAQFQSLGMTQEVINKFFNYFIQCDTDGSGEISLPEFYEYFGKDNGIEQTIFTDKVFLIFDEDKSPSR